MSTDPQPPTAAEDVIEAARAANRNESPRSASEDAAFVNTLSRIEAGALQADQGGGPQAGPASAVDEGAVVSASPAANAAVAADAAASDAASAAAPAGDVVNDSASAAAKVADVEIVASAAAATSAAAVDTAAFAPASAVASAPASAVASAPVVAAPSSVASRAAAVHQRGGAPSLVAPAADSASLRARRSRWPWFGILTALFGFALLLHWQTQQRIGIARDETVYMTYGTRYANWWRDVVRGKPVLTAQAITAHFGGPNPTDNNREHPPLLKTLSGFAAMALAGDGQATPTAYRVPAMVLNALLVVLVAVWSRRLWGAPVALAAALLTLLVPRTLFHGGLACFDQPMVTFWLATLYAYWRGLRARKWRVLSGLCFGLALATKHNALMLPGVVLPHYVWYAWQSRVDGKRRWWQYVTSHGSLWWPIALGPLVLFALWPWLWLHPIANVRAWLQFHLTHVHYNFEYLGRNWNAPPFPWHVALVTTWFTLPAATLGAALFAVAHASGQRAWAWWHGVRKTDIVATNDRDAWGGSAGAGSMGATTTPTSLPLTDASPPVSAMRAALRGEPRDGANLLLALSVAVAMGPFMLGTTPIFGAEKHWAAATPVIAMTAAVGAWRAATYFAQALVVWLPRAQAQAALIRRQLVAFAVLIIAIASAAAIEVRAAWPYPLSYYNAFAPGAPGGATLGMNRQFWGVAAYGVLPYFAAVAKRQTDAAPRAPLVYTHDAAPAWGWYQRLGLVDKRFGDAGPEEYGVGRSAFAFVVHEKHFVRHDVMIWKSYGTVTPVFVLTHQGVPLVSVYERPSPATAPLSPQAAPNAP